MTAALGIGTATFVPGYGLGQVGSTGVELIEAALDRGVRYVDTAAAYGDSERALGTVATRLAQGGVRVATKVSAAEARSGRDALVAAVRASLERLRVERVDTVLLHSAETSDLCEPSIGAAFEAVKRAGLAARAGASTYGVEAAEAALSQEWVDVVQVEHSLLNQAVVRAVAGGKRPGQELVARSVLCKGLLTARRAALGLLPPAVAEAVDRLEGEARDRGWALPELAIRFALDTPGVDVVVVGVGTGEELETALLASARPALGAARVAELAAFDRSGEDFVHPERWSAARAR